MLLKVKFLNYFKFMQTVAKLIFLIQKQISVKCFQILCCFVNTFLQIRIVSADKCISERKKTPAQVRKQTANQRSKCIQFSISLLQALYKGHHLLRQYIIPGLLNCSSEIYLKIFLRSLLAPAVYITLYFIYQIPVSFLLQLHLLNILCQL